MVFRLSSTNFWIKNRYKAVQTIRQIMVDVNNPLESVSKINTFLCGCFNSLRIVETAYEKIWKAVPHILFIVNMRDVSTLVYLCVGTSSQKFKPLSAFPRSVCLCSIYLELQTSSVQLRCFLTRWYCIEITSRCIWFRCIIFAGRSNEWWKNVRQRRRMQRDKRNSTRTSERERCRVRTEC